MSRRMALYGGGLAELTIATNVNVDTKGYYTRIDSREDHDTWIDGPARENTYIVDLTKYTKVHFQVTAGQNDRYIEAGSVSRSNPATGERVLDVSGIADRSSVSVKVRVPEVHADRPSYYPATFTKTNSITVSRIWATVK